MRYSKATNGFYTEDHPTIPEDAVQITDELYTALFEGQAGDKQITSDESGMPILIDLVVTPFTPQRAILEQQVQDQQALIASLITRIAALETA